MDTDDVIGGRQQAKFGIAPILKCIAKFTAVLIAVTLFWSNSEPHDSQHPELRQLARKTLRIFTYS